MHIDRAGMQSVRPRSAAPEASRSIDKRQPPPV
jgi:hypothetical protein